MQIQSDNFSLIVRLNDGVRDNPNEVELQDAGNDQVSLYVYDRDGGNKELLLNVSRAELQAALRLTALDHKRIGVVDGR